MSLDSRTLAVGRCLASLLPLYLTSLAGITFAEDEASLPYVQQEDVVFAQSHGIAVTMDIFTPRADRNGLAIVDVASGAWRSDRGKIRDHKRAQMYHIFCSRGYTVFAVRPGSLSRFSAFDMCGHIEQGIEWVQDHSEEFTVDRQRIGLTGASAGGHLACLVAVRKQVPIAAVGVFFPPTDFVQYGERRIDPRSDESVAKLVTALGFPEGVSGLSDDQVTEGLKAISPAHQVSAGLPPFLLIHGDADQVVPLQQSHRLKQALEAEQVPVELIIKPGGGHPWFTIPVEVAKLAEWFDRKLPSP